jgi:hypothetical protein
MEGWQSLYAFKVKSCFSSPRLANRILGKVLRQKQASLAGDAASLPIRTQSRKFFLAPRLGPQNFSPLRFTFSSRRKSCLVSRRPASPISARLSAIPTL